MFSFSLIWESIAAQFLTFVPHGEQTLVEKDSPASRITKSSFFSRSANFGNVSPFHILLPYPSTHKVAELCFEILQFILSARLLRLTPPSRSRHRFCRCTATSTHFRSFTLYKGWRIVPRKTWVSENFGPISKSRKRFLRVSKSRFRVFFLRLGVSNFFSFCVFVWFSEVEFFRVQGYILWK